MKAKKTYLKSSCCGTEVESKDNNLYIYYVCRCCWNKTTPKKTVVKPLTALEKITEIKKDLIKLHSASSCSFIERKSDGIRTALTFHMTDLWKTWVHTLHTIEPKKKVKLTKLQKSLIKKVNVGAKAIRQSLLRHTPIQLKNNHMIHISSVSKGDTFEHNGCMWEVTSVRGKVKRRPILCTQKTMIKTKPEKMELSITCAVQFLRLDQENKAKRAASPRSYVSRSYSSVELLQYHRFASEKENVGKKPMEVLKAFNIVNPELTSKEKLVNLSKALRVNGLHKALTGKNIPKIKK